MDNTNPHNRAITRFQAMFLPNADPIVTAARQDFTDASNVVTSLQHNPIPNAHAMATLNASANAVDLASRTRADHWLDNVFATLERLVVGIHRPDVGFANDILYIITTPEFALNGWVEGGATKWSGVGAFPQSLETHIQDRARTKLLSDQFKNLHILFTFSCCTYTPGVVVDFTSPLGPVKRIGYTNSMTVMCINSAQDNILLRKVAKSAWNPADGSYKDNTGQTLFAIDRSWDPVTRMPSSGASPRLNRWDETQITLPLKDIHDQSVAIAFATCHDVLSDDHHQVNLVVVSGSGAPFIRPGIKDKTHPFLFNDGQYSWSTAPLSGAERFTTAELWAAGYYQFLGHPPALGAENVQQKFMGSAKGNAGGVDPSMAGCYQYPLSHESAPVSPAISFAEARTTRAFDITVPAGAPSTALYIYTDVINIPARSLT